MMKRLLLFFGFAFVCVSASAQFVDTNWTVVEVKGETWYANSSAILGQVQSFEKGWAQGPFFNCDFDGLSKTYTSYKKPKNLLKNPEFRLLKDLDLEFNDGRIFVHRISCEGYGVAKKRMVLYPFITQEGSTKAYYIFEGAVYALEAEKVP